MILIDFSNVIIGSIMVSLHKNSQLIEEDYIRHLVLNSLRKYRVKHRKKYGELVICADGENSWRKDIFSDYKAGRKRNKDKSGIDWNELFEVINNITEELKNNFPYKVIKIPHVEGDDIIAILSDVEGENLIVSADKDFVQLQKNPNVKQWSPILKKFLEEQNPQQFLIEHIIRGDKGDGIPNILSPENSFVAGIRQKAIREKQVKEWVDNPFALSRNATAKLKERYELNKKLIDFAEIPDHIVKSIKDEFNKPLICPNRNKILTYFVKNRLKLLTDCIGEF